MKLDPGPHETTGKFAVVSVHDDLVHIEVALSGDNPGHVEIKLTPEDALHLADLIQKAVAIILTARTAPLGVGP